MRRTLYAVISFLIVGLAIVQIPVSVAFAKNMPMITNLSEFFTFLLELQDNWRICRLPRNSAQGISIFIFEHMMIIDEAGEKLSPTGSFVFEAVSSIVGFKE